MVTSLASASCQLLSGCTLAGRCLFLRLHASCAALAICNPSGMPHCVSTRRTYTYTVRGKVPGSLVNSVTLPKADNNATNNNATSPPVTVFGTCGNPFGNGSSVSCPPGSVTNASAANSSITDEAAIFSVCCVSVSWLVVGPVEMGAGSRA